MFLHLLHVISVIHHFIHIYYISKNHNLFHICLIRVIEDPLIGPVYGNIFLEFSVILKLDSERIYLNLPTIDMQKVMG